MITPDTLPRHELIGLPVRVADATSADYVGIEGRVVRESQRTITVRTQSGDKRVPKAGTTFEFAIPDADSVNTATDEAADSAKESGSTFELGSETAGVRPCKSGPSSSNDTAANGAATDEASRSLGECEDVVYVTVDGDRLLSRPAERTERGVYTWR
ncbi:ribonuclease P protein component 1 [Haloparvum sp. AD34]